jgi:hypothetical protein
MLARPYKGLLRNELKELKAWAFNYGNCNMTNPSRAVKPAQTSDAENNDDRDSPGNPNGMGPTMRPVSVPTASAASGYEDDACRFGMVERPSDTAL